MARYTYFGTLGRRCAVFFAFYKCIMDKKYLHRSLQANGQRITYYNIIIKLYYINSPLFNLKNDVFTHPKPCQRRRKQGKRVMDTKWLIANNSIFSIGF